ncbi:hypothetical protein CEXT_151431 [Caerostris extrusa]|uniref:Uncharacterized protein n=1 Tax=Caerostris extrusa TaxID=172846 RepID=A0AAV4SVA0_CAEEX|nr:hypothetical protein CEXT_151431 [Caerostris extrusa]
MEQKLLKLNAMIEWRPEIEAHFGYNRVEKLIPRKKNGNRKLNSPAVQHFYYFARSDEGTRLAAEHPLTNRGFCAKETLLVDRCAENLKKCLKHTDTSQPVSLPFKTGVCPLDEDQVLCWKRLLLGGMPSRKRKFFLKLETLEPHVPQ